MNLQSWKIGYYKEMSYLIQIKSMINLNWIEFSCMGSYEFEAPCVSKPCNLQSGM